MFTDVPCYRMRARVLWLFLTIKAMMNEKCLVFAILNKPRRINLGFFYSLRVFKPIVLNQAFQNPKQPNKKFVKRDVERN